MPGKTYLFRIINGNTLTYSTLCFEANALTTCQLRRLASTDHTGHLTLALLLFGRVTA